MLKKGCLSTRVFVCIFFLCSVSLAVSGNSGETGTFSSMEIALAPPQTEENPNAQAEKEGRPLRKKAAALPQRIIESRFVRDYTDSRSSIPGLEHEMTQYWIRHYTTNGRLQWLASVLRNGEPYLDFIRTEIRARRLPEELLYLPVIESGYSITARSSSGARGLWQFMRNSMSPWMKFDDWVDERLDFWKSTGAAFSKLEENYRNFGSWPLALAAYNSGSGAISRILKDNPGADYWTLAVHKKFKTESVHYVPKLLAVHYIASNPRKFNLNINTAPESYIWTRVEVPKQANIVKIAEYAGLDADTLRNANRELVSLVTPPRAGYFLKVRAQDAAAVINVLQHDDLSLINYHVYTVKSGDTLYALAQHYGVSVENIMTENPELNARALLPGTRISIPAIKPVESYSAVIADTPPAGNAEWSSVRRIQKGDTLWSIAREYQTTAMELARMNNISTDTTLNIGKTLRVPKQ